MARFPENFGLIHDGEEYIRRESITAIEDDDLSLHAEAVEGAVSIVRYYILRDDHRGEDVLRDYVATKHDGAERLESAFAPKTRWGMVFGDQVIRAFAIPGLARLAVGREIIDAPQLPQYPWPSHCRLEA